MLRELTTTEVADYYRPNFFVNTPDINPYFLQSSGRAGFLIRAALAATLSGLWGVYSGFELCEAAAEHAPSRRFHPVRPSARDDDQNDAERGKQRRQRDEIELLGRVEYRVQRGSPDEDRAERREPRNFFGDRRGGSESRHAPWRIIFGMAAARCDVVFLLGKVIVFGSILRDGWSIGASKSCLRGKN